MTGEELYQKYYDAKMHIFDGFDHKAKHWYELSNREKRVWNLLAQGIK